ncbi:MAG: hypothetical protein LBV55_03150 [Acholeplasmatales bacterium]|jgi:hypothetical protein|nr:hypothetical protein [Acholeplasmatales bacterium]
MSKYFWIGIIALLALVVVWVVIMTQKAIKEKKFSWALAFNKPNIVAYAAGFSGALLAIILIVLLPIHGYPAILGAILLITGIVLQTITSHQQKKVINPEEPEEKLAKKLSLNYLIYQGIIFAGTGIVFAGLVGIIL